MQKQQELIKKAIPAIEEEEEIWRRQKVDLKLLPDYYMRLAKIRLTGELLMKYWQILSDYRFPGIWIRFIFKDLLVLQSG